MRRITIALLIVVLAVIAQPAIARNVENFHHPATVVELDATTCAWTAPFIYEVECSDTFVSYGSGAVLLPHLGIFTMPLHENIRGVFVYNVHYILHPGPSPEEPESEFLYERFGFVQEPRGYMDTVRLLRADVNADVPMDDGSTLSLDLHWDFAGRELNVSGNDGPIQEEGSHWGTQGGDRCFTSNWHAHQTWRWGGGGSAISGTLDGVDASTLSMPPDEAPFIGRGVFTIIETEHGGCP